MQNAELYRRGIVLPLDQDAEDCLRANDVNETTNVELLEISGSEVFDTLWHLGLFREINNKCRTLLDDYEEDMVECDALQHVVETVDFVAQGPLIQQPDTSAFLGDLRDLASRAIILHRPILFVL